MRKVKLVFVMTLAVLLIGTAAACIKNGARVDFIVQGKIYHSINTAGMDEIELPQEPQIEGFDFRGWYEDEGTWLLEVDKYTFLEREITQNLRIYAWIEEYMAGTAAIFRGFNKVGSDSYTISVPNSLTSFNFNNYVEVHEDSTWAVSTDVEAFLAIPSRVASLSVGDNTFYVMVTANDDVRLYTVNIRRKPIYTVTFNTLGGSAVQSQSVEEEGFALSPSDATREGYSFVRWDYDFLNPIMEDTVIEAVWNANTYTITYRYNLPLSTLYGSQSVTYGENVQLMGDNGYVPHFVLDGWSNLIDGNIVYLPQQEITYNIADNTTLFTVYAAKDYEISYSLDGGTHSGNPTSYTVLDSAFSLQPAAKYGHTFEGWYLDAQFSKSASELSIANGGNITLYAHYNVYGGGSGTVQDPYIIYNEEHLRLFNSKCTLQESYYSNKSFSLTSSIDLEGGEWSTIERFNGRLDGNGFSVSNFTITSESSAFVGFFGRLGGTVKNLSLISIEINPLGTTGESIYAGGLAGVSDTEIINCHVSGEIDILSDASLVYAGLLVGQGMGAMNCSAQGALSVEASGQLIIAGGLVGADLGAAIENCHADTEVNALLASVAGEVFAGGLVGQLVSSSNLARSYATGSVTATGYDAYVGGLIGHNAASVQKSYATGNVSGEATNLGNAGGLVGYNSGTVIESYALGDVDAQSQGYMYGGGVVGHNSLGTLNSCHAAGDINAQSINMQCFVGGIAGRMDSSMVLNSVFYGNVTAKGYSAAYGAMLVGYSSGNVTNSFYIDSGIVQVHIGSNVYGSSNSFGSSALAFELDSTVFYANTVRWDSSLWNYTGLDVAGGILPTFR